MVSELNDVLDMREKSLDRARRRAGDLAHGLKTPLTVLQAVARDIRGRKLVRRHRDRGTGGSDDRHIRTGPGPGQAVKRSRPCRSKSGIRGAKGLRRPLSRMPGARISTFDIKVPSGTRIPWSKAT